MDDEQIHDESAQEPDTFEAVIEVVDGRLVARNLGSGQERVLDPGPDAHSALDNLWRALMQGREERHKGAVGSEG